jgi:hypothetical protein
MGLSLDAIYKPLNDFFLKEFGATAGAPVKFRFAHTAHTLVDGDFIPPLHPEFGPSPSMALQIFSILVDGIPTLDSDGHTVWIGPGSISDLYHDEILEPSLPFFPASMTSDQDKQSVIDSFSQLKADARLDWEHSKASSLLPGEEALQFRPSTPFPESWWQQTGWIPKSFEIAGAVTDAPANDQILRLKLNDSQAQQVLLNRFPPPTSAPATPKPTAAVNHPLMMMAAAPMRTQVNRPAMVATHQMVAPVPVSAVTATRTIAINPGVYNNSAVLPFRERMVVQSTLGAAAPMQSVVSTNVTITFDYCVVTATRQWMHDAFLDSRSWWISSEAKGELSANNGHGLPAVPVGFVAVKALKIKAPWTPTDITNLNQSVQFGPFKFDSTVVDGAIGHAGMQIVGWMLRDMGNLPPNGPA